MTMTMMMKTRLKPDPCSGQHRRLSNLIVSMSGQNQRHEAFLEPSLQHVLCVQHFKGTVKVGELTFFIGLSRGKTSQLIPTRHRRLR